ncbi:hypothetical protein INS90_02770 [Trueperella pecoris]|uniref:Lipoprotein n=1 Tax=Trueperella pecoris TaxID=2733571 RepID=A0A7M1R224_9ACTO|nr:hypothetical protein [Trueperella pecoris]QOR48228.1 hypothetical protein INS90_02770 [Trueperella pecoris]
MKAHNWAALALIMLGLAGCSADAPDPAAQTSAAGSMSATLGETTRGETAPSAAASPSAAAAHFEVHGKEVRIGGPIRAFIEEHDLEYDPVDDADLNQLLDTESTERLNVNLGLRSRSMPELSFRLMGVRTDPNATLLQGDLKINTLDVEISSPDFPSHPEKYKDVLHSDIGLYLGMPMSEFIERFGDPKENAVNQDSFGGKGDWITYYYPDTYAFHSISTYPDDQGEPRIQGIRLADPSIEN